ncbi:MAG: efflux RND transporter periplasmic adaptor subunit [Pseudomonadota bacterium]
MPENLHKTGSLLLLCLLCAACAKEQPPSARGSWGAPPKVITASVELKPLVDEIEALGTATANESITIQPRVSSLVTRVAFEEGEIVEKGELLIELESSEIEAGLALAEATLAESQSLYTRSQSLAASKVISAAELEQLLARVKVDQAQVQAAQARLANTRIVAPFTGRVGLRRISPGSYVDPATIITTLDDVSIIKLDFSVPETFLTVVSNGMSIAARSIVFPDRVFEGKVASVDTRLDPVSRSVQVRATLPNADAALKPGMFLTIDLERDSGDVLVVPEQSIVPEGSQQFVFIVSGGIVEKRPVLLGRRIPGFVVIQDGVAAGEQVVTEGTNKVRDGSEVEALEESTSLVRNSAGV